MFANKKKTCVEKCFSWRVILKKMTPLCLLYHHPFKVRLSAPKFITLQSVFTHVTSIYANLLEQKKAFI